MCDMMTCWALVSLVRYVRRADLWFVGGCSISRETRLMNMCDIMTCRALVSLVRLLRRADLWFVGGCSISCERDETHSHVRYDDLYGWALVSLVRYVRWDDLYVFTLVAGLQYSM